MSIPTPPKWIWGALAFVALAGLKEYNGPIDPELLKRADRVVASDVCWAAPEPQREACFERTLGP